MDTAVLGHQSKQPSFQLPASSLCVDGVALIPSQHFIAFKLILFIFSGTSTIVESRSNGALKE